VICSNHYFSGPEGKTHLDNAAKVIQSWMADHDFLD
jgi:hypothetical protein